jgi:hypothetical protein
MRALLKSSAVAFSTLTALFFSSVAFAQEPQAAPPPAPAPEALPDLPAPVPALPPPVEAAPASDPPVVEVLPPEPQPLSPMVDEAPRKKRDDAAKSPFFAGVGVGYGWVTANHPQLAATTFTGAVVDAHFGYTLSENFAVAIDISNFETGIERLQKGQPFTTHDQLYPKAASTKPANDTGRGSSGWVLSTTMNLTSMGARIDYTPFGRDGIYIGATAGPAVMSGLDQGLVGFGATARAGLRGRVATVLTFAVEGGFTGQTFTDASSTMPYVGAVFRPYF